MGNGNMDIIGFVTNALTDTIYFVIRLFTGNSHKRTIFIIFKRNDICVKDLENRNPSNEYPRFIKQVGQVLYYKMPIGMSFKQVEKINDVFESHLKSEVKIIELKDHPNAHFSITTELSHPDKLAENKYKKETKNDENPHEASVFGIIKC